MRSDVDWSFQKQFEFFKTLKSNLKLKKDKLIHSLKLNITNTLKLLTVQ